MIHLHIFLQIAHRSPKWPLLLSFQTNILRISHSHILLVRNLNSRAPTGFSRMILLHGISVSQSDIISHLLHWQTTFAHHNEN